MINLMEILNSFSDKVFHDKTFNIAETKNPKYDAYQRGLAAMV